MNYLTNYYKNLSEQLQQRVNHLQKLLKESETKTRIIPSVMPVQPTSGNPNKPSAEEPKTNFPGAWGTEQYPTAPMEPQNFDKWSANNPKPNPSNFEGGQEGEEFKEANKNYYDKYYGAKEKHTKWKTEVAKRNRVAGDDSGKQVDLPDF